MSEDKRIAIVDGMVGVGDIVYVCSYSSGWNDKKVKIVIWNKNEGGLITTEAMENFPGYKKGRTLFFNQRQVRAIKTSLEIHLKKLVRP